MVDAREAMDSQRGLPSDQDTDTFAGRDGLAVQFARFARDVQHQDDPNRTLDEIVRAAVALVTGCDEGSISVLLGRRRVTSESASGSMAACVDALQESTGQGPCLDAAAMLSCQLYVDGDDLGALNLFSRTAGAFDDASEHVGLLFAAHVAVAYAASRSQERLARSVVTRQLIGQAQGILMERHRLTTDQAFALLVRVSQERNDKLRDVAETLVHSGVLPGKG